MTTEERSIAIVRPPPNSFSNCVTKHNERPDAGKAKLQWTTYKETIAKACNVVELPVLENHPDSIFVEDTCIVVGKNTFIYIT